MQQNSLASQSSFSREKLMEDSTLNEAGDCTIMTIYHTKIADLWQGVTVVWSKNLIHHSVSIAIGSSGNINHQKRCKIDLMPLLFLSKKGFKSLEVEGKRVDVFWDLRSAKFSSRSEPTSDYYIAIVCDEEVVLLLGDSKKEVYERTKSRPSLTDAILVSKRENVFGKKRFSTRAKFDERTKEHDIVLENMISGPNDPEMWIRIDGLVLLHVTNLQWKFRGNETVLVNKLPVQIFWDVHDWLFSSPGTGHALFIFKPLAQEFRLDDTGYGGNFGRNGGENEASGNRYDSVEGPKQVPQFCLFLYAWKVG